jgi:alkylated DNA repair dioxygenase AlkB
MSLMLPPGFSYHPSFLARDEEAALLRIIQGLAFEPVTMQGMVLHRTAVHYGMKYDYASERGVLAPLPDFLLPLRTRLAALAGIAEAELVGAVILRYPPGAGIAWHRDHEKFGDVVAGISLKDACRLQLKDPAGTDEEEQVLEPRSAYLLRGVARWKWEHSIPPVPGLRYSITFRQLGRLAR